MRAADFERVFIYHHNRKNENSGIYRHENKSFSKIADIYGTCPPPVVTSISPAGYPVGAVGGGVAASRSMRSSMAR